jgi:hypothetical protein
LIFAPAKYLPSNAFPMLIKDKQGKHLFYAGVAQLVEQLTCNQ